MLDSHSQFYFGLGYINIYLSIYIYFRGFGVYDHAWKIVKNKT